MISYNLLRVFYEQTTDLKRETKNASAEYLKGKDKD